MSQENVDILRRAGEVFLAGDLDRWLSEFIAPEVEWHTTPEDPDAAIHRGREACRRYVHQWRDAFDGLRFDVQEYIDVGDDRVLTWMRWQGRSRVGGVDTEWWLAIIYTMSDGKVIRAQEYFNRAEALEAVGLRE